jgi:hypothetical protein
VPASPQNADDPLRHHPPASDAPEPPDHPTQSFIAATVSEVVWTA